MKEFIKNHKISIGRLIFFSVLLWVGSLFITTQIWFCFFLKNHCLDINILGNWDGQHFLSITQHGYVKSSEFAFFPLLPLAIYFFSNFFSANELVTGLIFNWIIFFVSLFFLYRLLCLDYKKNTTLGIFLFLLCFPLSFFFLVFYSEALYFCLSILAFYLYRKNKNSWLIIVLTLLTLTRMAGIAMVFAIVCDRYLKREPIGHFLLPLGGVLSFVLYGYIQTGHPLAMVAAESHWERYIGLPGTSFFRYIFLLLTQGISVESYSVVCELLLACVTLVILVKSYKLLPRVYWLYSLFSVLIPFSTSTFLSFPRFLSVIFPLFIAFYFMSNKIIRIAYVTIGFVMLQILFLTFLQGGWVA